MTLDIRPFCGWCSISCSCPLQQAQSWIGIEPRIGIETRITINLNSMNSMTLVSGMRKFPMLPHLELMRSHLKVWKCQSRKRNPPMAQKALQHHHIVPWLQRSKVEPQNTRGIRRTELNPCKAPILDPHAIRSPDPYS